MAAIRRIKVASIAALAGVAAVLVACGGDTGSGCERQSSTFGRSQDASGRIVLDVAGDGYCSGPVEILVVREPPANGTLGMQVENGRFAVVATADGPSFHRAVPLDPAIRLQDGTTLEPSSQAFQIIVRQQQK